MKTDQPELSAQMCSMRLFVRADEVADSDHRPDGLGGKVQRASPEHLHAWSDDRADRGPEAEEEELVAASVDESAGRTRAAARFSEHDLAILDAAGDHAHRGGALDDGGAATDAEAELDALLERIGGPELFDHEAVELRAVEGVEPSRFRAGRRGARRADAAASAHEDAVLGQALADVEEPGVAAQRAAVDDAHFHVPAVDVIDPAGIEEEVELVRHLERAEPGRGAPMGLLPGIHRRRWRLSCRAARKKQQQGGCDERFGNMHCLNPPLRFGGYYNINGIKAR